MAHECLECGQACYCDMDDTWMEAPRDCRHQCPPEDEEWDDEASCASDIERIRQAVTEVLDAYEVAPRRPFAWPTDGVANRPWGYWIHVGWVNAWNREGRETPAVPFIRAWLTDENIAAALKAKREFESLAAPPDTKATEVKP